MQFVLTYIIICIFADHPFLLCYTLVKATTKNIVKIRTAMEVGVNAHPERPLQLASSAAKYTNSETYYCSSVVRSFVGKGLPSQRPCLCYALQCDLGHPVHHQLRSLHLFHLPEDPLYNR